MAYNWKDHASGFGQMGAGLYGLFNNNKNPMDEANKTIDQIPGKTAPHTQPWEDAGKNMLPGLQDQYTQGMNDPGGKYNQIGENFHQSPGFKFAMEQALGASGNSAAAGGMAGSPAHMQGNQEMATNMANQDYYNYMQGATGIYGDALKGAQGMANQGQSAGQSQADTISQAMAQHAANQAEGQDQKNRNKTNAWGNILGGLGSFLF